MPPKNQSEKRFPLIYFFKSDAQRQEFRSLAEDWLSDDTYQLKINGLDRKQFFDCLDYWCETVYQLNS